MSRHWKGDLERVITTGKTIHGENSYDYSHLRAEDIELASSRLDLICLRCDCPYNPTIDKFINGRTRCPCYSGHISWKGDLSRVLIMIRNIHGDNKYDCSRIKAESIEGALSRLDLTCLNCLRLHTPTINNFINNRRGCPCYSNNIPWKDNFSGLLIAIQAIHGENMYDYSRIKLEDIENEHSRLDLTCRNCMKLYNPTIAMFINLRANCPCYTDNIKWRGDLPRLLIAIKEAHGDRYDCSRLTSGGIETSQSRLDLTCLDCMNTYQPSIDNFINKRAGCPCHMTRRYSKMAIEYLSYIAKRDNVHIRHAENGGEYYIPGIGHVDGFCEEDKKVHEFHGNRWHGNPRIFKSDHHEPDLSKQMGQLYQETLERMRKIESLGYKLEYIWEDEWEEMKKNLVKTPNIIILRPTRRPGG